MICQVCVKDTLEAVWRVRLTLGTLCSLVQHLFQLFLVPSTLGASPADCGDAGQGTLGLGETLEAGGGGVDQVRYESQSFSTVVSSEVPIESRQKEGHSR